MSNKIYAVWGGKNSGKTTFAVNLACTLSKRDVLVGLISTNLIYGDLQVFFGQSVPEVKGLFQALNDDNPNIGEKFMEYEQSKNLFFLSLPTNGNLKFEDESHLKDTLWWLDVEEGFTYDKTANLSDILSAYKEYRES